MKMDRARELEKEMLTCTFCGFCKSVCPYFEDNQWDPSVARGKVILAYGLARNEIEPDDSVVKRMYQCTTCKDCERRCPSNIRVIDIVQATRADLVKAGHVIPAHAKIVENIENTGNPYGETKDVDFGVHPKEANVGYFIGCTARYRNTSIAQHSISILKKLRIDFTLIDEVCCGSTLHRIGQPQNDFVRLMKENVKAAQDRGVKKLLFTCAGCLHTFKEEYAKHLDCSFEVEHMVQFLARQNLKLRPLPRKITYHDPCHIGRHMKIYEEPRALLKKIPEAEFVEMRQSQESSRCCGGGGGVRSADPDASRRMASKRLDSASEVADVLVTSCPFCVNTLEFGNETVEADIEILDITELIDGLLVTSCIGDDAP
ncbi:MAG: (Fe-S)-binding protein [Methanobacteriota archaeon]|nr:MAG: (Fe-S)-binding protein [Euryarchaeota archaeon]